MTHLPRVAAGELVACGSVFSPRTHNACSDKAESTRVVRQHQLFYSSAFDMNFHIPPRAGANALCNVLRGSEA